MKMSKGSYLRRTGRILILGISIFMASYLVSDARAETETVLLTYKNFSVLSNACTYEDNWCTYANYRGKAVIYGYMEKEIEIPEGATGLEVAIQICSEGWGEGLAADIDEWTPNSALQIIVNEEIWEVKIPKLSPGNPHIHHYGYYKYEWGERFSSDIFDLSGKDYATLTIKMVDGARLDFWEAILTFYVPECKGDFDQDGDVDGSDLGVFAAGGTGLRLGDFVAEFGRKDCPVCE